MLYEKYQHELRFSTIKPEELLRAKHLIWQDAYHLKPVSCIFLEAGFVDEGRMQFRGVPVTVLKNPPAGVRYQCLYMDPL